MLLREEDANAMSGYENYAIRLLLAIFYTDDSYIASIDELRLQESIDSLVAGGTVRVCRYMDNHDLYGDLFARKSRTHLSDESYTQLSDMGARLNNNHGSAAKWIRSI